jgi:hypothetical protein
MEYLEINRPDERYCDGCPLTESYESDSTPYSVFCFIDGSTLLTSDGKLPTPPNCPLKKVEEK